MADNIQFSNTANNDPCQLVSDIFKFLKNVPDEWHYDKLFSGEKIIINEKIFDCETIAVKAKSLTVGCTLLLFLRMILDNNIRLPIEIFFENRIKKKDVNISQIIHSLVKYEISYTSINTFNNDDDNDDIIDMWTIERIEKTILEKLNKNMF